MTMGTQKPLFRVFEKAFDTVSHKMLWWVMVDIGFALHLVSMIESLCVAQN